MGVMDNVVQLASERFLFARETHHFDEAATAQSSRAVGCDAIEAARRRVEDGFELRFAFAQRLLVRLALSDVAIEDRHAAVGSGIGAHVEPSLMSLGKGEQMFLADRLAMFDDACIEAVELAVLCARPDVPMRPPDERLARPALHAKALRINGADDVVPVEQHEAVGHILQQGAA